MQYSLILISCISTLWKVLDYGSKKNQTFKNESFHWIHLDSNIQNHPKFSSWGWKWTEIHPIKHNSCISLVLSSLDIGGTLQAIFVDRCPQNRQYFWLSSWDFEVIFWHIIKLLMNKWKKSVHLFNVIDTFKNNNTYMLQYIYM